MRKVTEKEKEEKIYIERDHSNKQNAEGEMVSIFKVHIRNM